MMPFAMDHLNLLDIDSRPCVLCSLTLDQHELVDDGDGPLHYCPDQSPDEMTLVELERRAELIRQEEAFATMARWEAMDAEIDARRRTLSPRLPGRRTAQSTRGAFAYVVSLGDPAYLEKWLSNHPLDAPTLLLGLPELV